MTRLMDEFSRHFQTAFTLLLIAAVFLLSDLVGLAKPMRQAVNFIALPLERLTYQGGRAIAQEVSIFWELRSVLGKYYALEKEHRETVAHLNNLSQVAKENEILKAQFARSPVETQKLLPAQVMGVSRYLILNKGQQDGVKGGQVVVLENSLIGKVVEVTATSARVLLPTDPNSEITAEVAGGSYRPRGLVVGDFGVGMHLEKILPDEMVEVGDLVLTSGELTEGSNEGYPKDLVIGKISKVQRSDSDLFQRAEVEPIFSYRDLDLVFVWIN